MRIAAGQGRLDLELPERSTLGDALDLFYERHAPLRPHRPTARPAIGQEYARGDASLRDGDEISLIPPVQGG
jgi:molybdopterin converting factor small subunit